MALGPKQMGEAIIRNLKKKTGKTLEQWIDLLHRENLQNKKEIIAFLKTKHGLGHFQSQKVFEHFDGKDNYEDPSTFADEIFASNKSKELYEFSKSKILEIANNIRVQPCKTYIPFYGKSQFAILTKSKGENIVLGLNLPDDYDNPKFSENSKTGSERINRVALIKSTSDLDQKVMEAVLTAYKNN